MPNNETFSRENVMKVITRIMQELDLEGIVSVLHHANEQLKRVENDGIAPLWAEPYANIDPIVSKWLIDAEGAQNEQH